MAAPTKTRQPETAIEHAVEVILGVLEASPLTVWVQPQNFRSFLNSRLPDSVKDGVLELEVIWQSLLLIPGLQRQVMESFFDEILRQDMPWPMRAPKVLLAKKSTTLPAEEHDVH
ncbi:MAG: hypothetical protein AAGJ35_12125, partial [Myxococcota bacterium]